MSARGGIGCEATHEADLAAARRRFANTAAAITAEEDLLEENPMKPIEQQVQRLGELRRRRQEIESEEQRLFRAVRGQMAEHGLSVVRSDEYEAKLVTQHRLAVDPAKFSKAVTNREFVEAATISVTAARDILGDRKLRRISDVAETIQLRIAARPRSRAASPHRATASEATA